MIVSPQEYNSLTHSLRDPNTYAPLIRIPKDEPVYEVNLDTREISIPEFLSVQEDHNAEVVWFKVRRFYDNIDLFDSTCWIQYINADKEEYFYAAPKMVYSEDFGNEWILIPWIISKEVAKREGIVTFAFQFFKISEDAKRFLYVLNTQPAKGKILHGMGILPYGFLEDGTLTEEQTLPQREQLASEIHQLYEKINRLERDYELYWIQVN